MSYDVKLFCACNHIVDNEYYDMQLCPRCYGSGYYYDVYFDRSGKVVLSSKTIKLQQEMLKTIIDPKYKNVFHPLWGSEIDNIIGSKNLNLNKTKVEMLVRMALEHLKAVQINEYMTYNNLTPEEILDDIEYINVTIISPTSYQVEVSISNQEGQVLSQTVTL